MKNVTRDELINIINSTWNREELECKLREKEMTYEDFFRGYFKIPYAQEKQSHFLQKHFNLETDIEIINNLDGSSLINFIKAYSIYLFTNSKYPSEKYLVIKDFLCEINEDVLNVILPTISRETKALMWLNKKVLELLITEISNEKFKILCPFYMECVYNETKKKNEENYGFKLLEKIKQVSEEKYKIFIEYVQDKCIRSINDVIDNVLFDASWMNQVIDRLISDNNIEGLIKILDYKAEYDGNENFDIPLESANIRKILDKLIKEKVDLFGILNGENDLSYCEFSAFLELLTKKEVTLLDTFIKFYDYRNGENYHLRGFFGEKYLIENKETLDFLVLKAKESIGLRTIAGFIRMLQWHEDNYREITQKYSSKEELNKANEVLPRLKNAIVELKQYYIKLFSNDTKAQNEYSYYSNTFNRDLQDIEYHVVGIIKYNVSNEEIDKIIKNSPIPVLLNVLSKIELPKNKNGIIFSETFKYYVSQLGNKVFLSKNPEYIFKYLSNDKYRSIIPWEPLSTIIDDDFCQIASSRVDLFGAFVVGYNNSNGVMYDASPEHERFMNKITSSVLDICCKDEKSDHQKLFRLAIGSKNLKQMYKYYCKLTSKNIVIDSKTMESFIRRVIESGIPEYVFLIFTKVVENDRIYAYGFSFMLLNYIYQTGNPDLISIIKDLYSKMYTPIITDLLKDRGIELYEVLEENYFSYLNELESNLLNSEDNISFKESLQSKKGNVLAKK